MKKLKNKPFLRFPEFENEWQLKKVGTLTNRISNPVKVQSHELYKQIGIRSHGKGIFYKEAVTGKELGNKRVFWIKENTFIVNIVFAWEQAVAKTTLNEIGMVVSHRFPMYKPIEMQSELDYLLHFFLTSKGKTLLELASPGGAGRNKTLGQKEFENLNFLIPSVDEQRKIAGFLTAIDNKIIQLKQKKTLLEQYKKGVMQKIFAQEIRFNDDNGEGYPKWYKKKLGDIAKFRRGSFPQPYGLSKWYDDENGMPFIQVFDVDDNMLLKAMTKNRISKLGAMKSVFVEKGTLIITIQGSIGRIAKTQYDAFVDRTLLIFQSYKLPIIVDYFKFVVFLLFEIEKTKAPGGTIKTITKEVLTDFTVPIPSIKEQTKIANFLSAIDEKINRTENQIQKTQEWKKGLLQQMFV